MTIPVTIITGFLGSGKTTLLAGILRRPEFADTAVIINEFGAIGLDHALIERSDDSVIEIAGGCVCCAVRGELATTLVDLVIRRIEGRVRPFTRVVIETSGLSDPGPVARALVGDDLLEEHLRLDSIITVVDAVNGSATLEDHDVAVRQVAVADRLVITKSDLAPEGAEALRRILTPLNPGAPLLIVDHGRVVPAALFSSADRATATARWVSDLDRHAAGWAHGHGGGIAGHALRLDRPITRLGLAQFLGWLARRRGPDLLRVKGLVEVLERPGCPAVIHAVQHVLHPVVWLDAWPDADRQSRLVFITRGIKRSEIEQALARGAMVNESRSATYA